MTISRRTSCAAPPPRPLALPMLACLRAEGRVHLQVRQQPAGHAPDEQRAPRRWPTRSAPRPNGRVDIQVFPSSQLGSDTDMLSQLRSGGVEFFTLSGLILSTLVPAAVDQRHRLRVPRLRQVWKAMDGDLGAHVRGADRQGRTSSPMDKIWDNGFRQITSSTQADHDAGRPEGLQDPRAGVAALDLDVQGVRRRADLDQLHRGLFGAADQDRRRPGEPAGASSRRPSSTRCRSTARSPTTCGTASGSWPTGAPGTPAGRPAPIVAKHINAAGDEGARRRRRR